MAKAKQLPTDPQELERTVVGLAAAAFKNARKQHVSAQAVLDQGVWPTAFALAALAAEEVGKAALCTTLLAMPPVLREQSRTDFQKALTDHKAKAEFAQFVLAVSADQMPASIEQLLQDVIESAHRTNAVKFRGLYVDYTDTGDLLEPDDVGEDQARWMVASVAQLLQDSAPAESAVTDNPDDYLYYLRQWQESMDWETLETRVAAAPMDFLTEVRAFARDDAPPSPEILGERLVEQIAAASRELPPASPAPAALE